MKKVYLYLLVFFTIISLMGSIAFAVPLTIGPYTFADGERAFVDDATFISGDPTYIAHDPGESWHNFLGNTDTDLDAALTGSDITLGVDGGGINFDLFFTDNFAVNGSGADLIVYETVSPESFDLALYISGSLSSFVTYTPSATGFTVGDVVGTTNSGSLNAVPIDLSDFGILSGDTISTIRIWSHVGGFSFPSTISGADIVAIGALNSAATVPIPSTIFLIGIGMVGLIGLKSKIAGDHSFNE